MFPELSFKLTYGETGCDFCGVIETNDDGYLEEQEGVHDWIDSEGNECRYDSKLPDGGAWVIIATGELVEDQDDVWDRNPFADCEN